MRYFEANGFGADGGYSKKVEVVKVGPIPLIIPNVQGRVDALRFHDLHHVLTGYRTDLRGEFEVACFELGAGCGRLWFAWLINLAGIAGALVILRRAAHAWARGRRSGGLYHEEPAPGLRDWLGMLATAAVGLVVGGLVYLGPPALVVWLLWRLLAG